MVCIPQIPQDYANHFIYAQLMFIVLAFIVGITWSLAAVVVVSIGKKVVDFFLGQESVQMCVSKALVSILGGLVPFLCLRWPAWWGV